MVKKLSRGGRALVWLGCLLALILLASCAGGWGYEIERGGAEEEQAVTEEEEAAEGEEVAPSQPVTEEPLTKEPSPDLSHLIGSDPAEVDNSRLAITPVEELHVTGFAPEVDIAEYLTVDGLVDTPLTLTYEALMRYSTVTEIVLLICPGFFADNAEWTGVPVTTLLAEAGIKPQASQVTFHALDGYHQALSLEEVQREGVFLAHTVNGQILPKEHGYPLRLVVRGKYGNKWVKWVERIEVM